MRRWGIPVALVLLLVPVAPAQVDPPEENLLAFELSVDHSTQTINAPSQATFIITLRDLSMDSPNPILPEGAVSPAPIAHTTTFEVTPVEQKRGWAIIPPPSRVTYSGGETTAPLIVSATAQVESDTFPFIVNATMRANNMETTRSLFLLAKTEGLPTFSAQIVRGYRLPPDELHQVEFKINNLGIFDRVFDAQITDNPCGLNAAAPRGIAVPAKSSRIVEFTVETPADKFWYQSESCSLSIAVSPQDRPGQESAIVMGIAVDGFNVREEWIINTTILLLLVLLLIWLILVRKRRVEEEILGKPQKPWTIPAEKVYLDALNERDPRAAYVVRHALMEDEYSSALGWYHAYKKATRGRRKKERLIVKHERGYEKTEAKWAARIAATGQKADNREAKLQRKLERKEGKRHKKAVRRHDKAVRRLDAAAGKAHGRAMDKWEKRSRKAAKRGEPEPPEPVYPEPDYPEEPVHETPVLAEHKWARKEQRYRARMDRKADRIQARYVKAHERELAKVQRKVRRVARKLDDPDFVAEHPLLSDSPSP